jgi:hypothetical protein
METSCPLCLHHLVDMMVGDAQEGRGTSHSHRRCEWRVDSRDNVKRKILYMLDDEELLSCPAVLTRNAVLQVHMCSEDARAWASSYNYGGQYLQWSHAIGLVVFFSALMLGAVYITKRPLHHRRTSSGGVRSSLIESP